jgi:hypothetical protein
MESSLLTAPLSAAAGTGKDAATSAAGGGAQRFQELMRQTSPAPTTEQAPAVDAAGRPRFDVYTDEVPTAAAGQRGASLPPELEAVGKGLSDTLKLAVTGPTTLRDMKLTDPYMAQFRDGMLDALKFQGSMVNVSLTMKSIELSAQSFQTLYKMQG